MKTSVIWSDSMEFNGVIGEHTVRMDSKPPLGKNAGPTPKELVAMGLGGCTAMDVIALLKKHKQPPRKLQVEVEIESSSGGHPVVFEKALLRFVVEGAVDPEKLREAVQLSQSKYCGVSAMLSRSLPIEYRISLNGQDLGSGFAGFESNNQKESK